MARSNSSAATLRVRKPVTEGAKQVLSVPTLRWIVEDSPVDTLTNCTEVLRVLGDSLLNFRHGHGAFGSKEGEAYMRIVYTLADALEYEAKRAGEVIP